MAFVKTSPFKKYFVDASEILIEYLTIAVVAVTVLLVFVLMLLSFI